MSEKDKAELLDLIGEQKDLILELREQLAAQNEHLGMISERLNDTEGNLKSARKIVFSGAKK